MAKTDIAILGGGPGGYVAAIYAAGRGKKVTLIEKDSIGGVCLNKGCIPTKILINSLKCKEKAVLSDMVSRKDEVVNKLRNGVEGLLKARSVDIKNGSGSFVDGKIIEVGQERLEAESIIIATGAHPAELGPFKFDGQKIVSSDSLLSLKKVPEKLLVIGGGFIGCEFAYLYASLGAQVTIIEMMPRLLPEMDGELSENMEIFFKKKGINVLTKTKADGSMKEMFDTILVSVGRKPNTPGLGLEKIDVKTKADGWILAGENLKTDSPNVYAIGDVLGTNMLAHVASHEGIKACDNIMGGNENMDYSAVPLCVYTEPQVASVGMTKEKAEASGYEVGTSRFPFSALGKAHAIEKTEGFVKMVEDKKTGAILGVHMIGAGVTELAAEAALAVRLKLKASDLTETMHAHPTLSESLMEAAFGLTGKPIHTL